MDTNYYYVQNSRELDLLDLIRNWMSHWRSLIIFLFIGCFLGIGIGYASNTSNTSNTSNENNILPKKLSKIEQEQVDRLVALHDEYEGLMAEYNDPQNELAVNSKAGMLKNLTATNNSIDTRFDVFSDTQKREYLTRIGMDPKDYVQPEETETEIVDNNNRSHGNSIVLFAFAFIVLHVTIFSIIYLFSKKMRYTDDPVKILDCALLSATVDWGAIEKKNRIDRMIAGFGDHTSRRIPYDESQDLNADIINDIALANNINSLAIIYGNLKKQADELGTRLTEINEHIKVKCVESLFNCPDGIREIHGISAAVMLLGINNTDIRDIVNEKQNLDVRNIKLIGTIVYTL